MTAKLTEAYHAGDPMPRILTYLCPLFLLSAVGFFAAWALQRGETINAVCLVTVAIMTLYLGYRY